MKVLTWERVPVLTAQVDSITDLLNNQSLSYSFDTSGLEAELKSLETLRTKVEKVFGALSPEEMVRVESEGVSAEKVQQGSIEFQRRRNLCDYVSKLRLRSAALQMALGVCFVAHFTKQQEDARTVIPKCKLIYMRLLDTIMKMDHIPNGESGDEYIDTKTLNTELRLQQKLETIQTLWTGAAEEIREAREKSWTSVLEAIERDITTLNNDFKYKRLIKMVDAKYGSTQKIDFNDLYTLDFKQEGPWLRLAEQIQTELQDMTALKQKNTQLQDKQKEAMLQLITLRKEKDEALLISQQTDSKLSLALAKAEKVPALEIDLKDLTAKITSVQKQLDSSQ